MQREKENAYLTVYLAMILAVLLSFCLLLIEGARKNGAALKAACAADTALQSVLAEYHRELLEQYNLFAIDASYGTSFCGKRNTEAHLYSYLQQNLSEEKRDFFHINAQGAELTGVSILSDGNGAVFRMRAVEAIRDDVGLELLEQLQEWVQTVEINGLEEADPEQEKEFLDKEIEEYEYVYEGQDGKEMVKKLDNPTSSLNQLRQKGILGLVLEEGQEISGRTITQDVLISSRMEQGRVSVGNLYAAAEETLIDRFLFQEYLLRYCGYFGKEKQEGALWYQMEYVIAGKECDVDNLKSVAGRLCILREAANAIYLYSDAKKSGEVGAVAAAICTAVLAPELTPVLKGAIILGWAYAESLYDVKKLLSGEKIPLMKDEESWHLDLDSALAGTLKGDGEEKKGLSYADYLRIFMMLGNLDKLTARAMDMVEADIRQIPGNEGFRLDGCYDRVQTKINISGKRGDSFELIRSKGY